MKKIIVLLGVVACSYSSDWNLGNHGGLTLGEISLDHHDLGAFSLGGTESHSLDWFGGHLPIKVSDWHSSISGLHGANIIPTTKYIGIPTIQKVPISVPHPVVETVPQPYPVHVIVSKPVPFEVEKQVFKTVEKKVPTPVEKIIPIKIEKPVPFHVVKHVPVPVEKPIPIKIPVYKTIVHKIKH
ncbi:PREDICTED: proline-rich protein 4-like [Vollenhovia emeryi]|uniref:proline-rich protein 4-like n=1 Tax=Vollenhovia emeryi TaxID=411798 RepID=UPI0005F3A3BB|nr:PREDICTED: proline-rich protein 4-like [Vollenhovia emeryi]